MAKEKTRRIMLMKSRTILAAMLAATSAAVADTYQFIVSGYPATNESYPAASAGTALATATRSGVSAASPIEARYRTWNESDGIALRSDKYHATFVIILR